MANFAIVIIDHLSLTTYQRTRAWLHVPKATYLASFFFAVVGGIEKSAVCPSFSCKS
jgi:hypothetical protein